jgi:hypothetical protein
MAQNIAYSETILAGLPYAWWRLYMAKARNSKIRCMKQKMNVAFKMVICMYETVILMQQNA